MNRITEAGARIMVQGLVRSFVDATPWNEEPVAFVVRARRLQTQLGRIIGVTPTHYDIEELIGSYRELDRVDRGTHPDLRVNLAHTVDNALDLTEHLLARVNRETTDLLNNAGFGKQMVA